MTSKIANMRIKVITMIVTDKKPERFIRLSRFIYYTGRVFIIIKHENFRIRFYDKTAVI